MAQQNGLFPRPVQALWKASFDPRDFTAQGKNGLPRHGDARHDVRLPSSLFLLCSYGFQRAGKESSGTGKEFIPLCVEHVGQRTPSFAVSAAKAYMPRD
jgi:hypothetical protein